MAVRSDWSLELQIEIVLKGAVSESVRTALSAVLTHMHSGRSRKRRGGRTLVALLAEARAQAAAAEEWQTVRLVQDSIDYAEGRILNPEFEERYRLFQDGAPRSKENRDFLAQILWSSHRYVAEVCEKYLEANPQAGTGDLVAHIRERGEDSRFLEAPEDRPGRYVIPRGRAETALWLERVMRTGRIEAADPAEAARRLAGSPKALELLAADSEGQLLLQALEQQKRALDLDVLRKVVEDPSASEHALQRALDGQHWIFGGRFVGTAAQRRLVPGDEVDIPLIRGDGSLHIVELKRAMGLRQTQQVLVKRHRNAWVPSAPVHDAVAQAVNYLVGLDEHRDRIRDEFGLETRRASALVLIGHPQVQPEVPEEAINDALRTFNTHVNRVEVLTYKELIDHAARSLRPLEDS